MSFESKFTYLLKTLCVHEQQYMLSVAYLGNTNVMESIYVVVTDWHLLEKYPTSTLERTVVELFVKKLISL